MFLHYTATARHKILNNVMIDYVDQNITATSVSLPFADPVIHRLVNARGNVGGSGSVQLWSQTENEIPSTQGMGLE